MTPPEGKTAVVVCRACGAKWFPANWQAQQKCTACGHAEGDARFYTPEELAQAEVK